MEAIFRGIKHYTKILFKLAFIIILGVIIISIGLLIKYKPAFEVTFLEENLGYVSNKYEVEEEINNYVDNKENCIADVELSERPQYNFKLISNSEQTNEEGVLSKVADTAIVTYRMFAIKLNGEVRDYVESLEEAEELVASMQNEYGEEINVDLTIEEVYTKEIPEVVAIETAKAEIGEELGVKLQQKLELKEEALAFTKVYTSRGANVSRMSKSVVDLGDIDLIEPVNGTISSRFGAISSIRPSAHKGLDIATANGTGIKVVADGIVTFAGWDKYYGNYVMVLHKNGIETCYAHCSKLYVEAGEEVKQGDIIAAVGSTGNSTGNHLHLEIRKDGVALNPLHYLYK